MEVRKGFKQTKVGIIPEEWEVKPLKFLSSFITKGATPTTYGFKWERDGVLFLRSECVSDDGLDLSQSMYISREAHNALVRGEVLSGDILMTITGNVGRVIILDKEFGIANTNQHIARIRIIDPNSIPEYIYHTLSQPSVRKYYNSITTGQAYPQTSLVQVRDTEIPIPPLPEQQAIAAALSDVDALLNSLDALIAKKRLIKQGAMQELLTGKKRLPGFGGEWEVKSLDTISFVTSGKRLPLGKSLTDNETRHPYIRVTDMRMGNVELSDIKFVPDDVFPAIKNYRIFKDDIFISVAGTLGIVGKIPLELDGANLTENADRITNITCSRDYLLHILMSPLIQNTIEAAQTIGAQPKLALIRIRKFDIPLPPTISEQTAIAEILSDMDAEISALEQKREKTRLLKQGMMQELLTGRIRLL